MNTTSAAPRLRASMPIAPVPAKRSAKRAPEMFGANTLNKVSRKRSLVGRSARPFKLLRMRLRYVPAMTRIEISPCLSRYAPSDSGAAILPAACARYAAASLFARNRRPGQRLRGGPVQATLGRAQDWRCESRGRRTGECRRIRPVHEVAGEPRRSCAGARPEYNATYPRRGQYAREADGAARARSAPRVR